MAGWGLCRTTPILLRASPQTPENSGQSAFHFSRPQSMEAKGMGGKMQQGSGRSGGLHINIRVSPEEKNRVAEQAALSGLSVSEYMRRRFFGGRPILAKADLAMIAELRQLGGLLKSHFDLLRKVGVKPEIINQMESTLRQLRHAAEIVGLER